MTGKWEDRVRQKGQDGANEKEQGIGKDWDTNHILDRLPLKKRLNLMTLSSSFPWRCWLSYLTANGGQVLQCLHPEYRQYHPGQQCHGPTCGGMWTTACTALS